MSLSALKKEVRELSVVERIELADYIAKQDASSDEARRARIERRMKRRWIVVASSLRSNLWPCVLV